MTNFYNLVQINDVNHCRETFNIAIYARDDTMNSFLGKGVEKILGYCMSTSGTMRFTIRVVCEH